jgi:MinD superfamily P-loop ATPase
VYSYDLVSRKPVVVKPYNCLVGCQTCANLCPVGAIEFPPPQVAQEAAKKYKIFVKVKKMLEEKFANQLIETAKQYAQESSKQEEAMEKIEECEKK